eukprot:1179616-Prorocentrum_minimum.AAC.1
MKQTKIGWLVDSFVLSGVQFKEYQLNLVNGLSYNYPLVRCTATSIRFNIERQNAFCSVLFICSLIASLLSGRRRSPNRDAPPGRQIISWHWAELH